MTIQPVPTGPGTPHRAQVSPSGLRERNKRNKLQRILVAATQLFAEHGYSQVTTQQIAEVAQVGTGTLFRYVGSKSELLVMVMNERLRLGTEQGIELARRGASPNDAIFAMLTPLAAESVAHPENTVIYQRETLFGSGPHRDLAAARVSQIEDAIRAVLLLHADHQRCPPAPHLADVAHVIYATVYIDFIRAGTDRTGLADLPERIRQSIEFLIEHLVTTPHREGCRPPD